MPGSKGKAGDLLKDSTPAGGGFANFFSLQAGSVMTATVLFGLAFAAFFYNISAPNPTEDLLQYASQYVVAYLFIVIIFFGTAAVSVGAFKFNALWVLIGSITLAIAAIVWCLISILCFIPSIEVYKYVCIHERCPPTVWLFEVTWRNKSAINPPIHLEDKTTAREPHERSNYDSRDTYNSSDSALFSALNVSIYRLHEKPRDRDANIRLPSDWIGNNKISYYWSWLLGMNSKGLSKRPAKPFLSSFELLEPRKNDHSIGLTIFCFIILTLFWIYSLWTMFSLHKELKTEELEEALESELSRRPSAGKSSRRQSVGELSRRPSVV